MDWKLMSLKQRMVKTSIEFIRAQGAYFKAASPNAGKSPTELKEAAEECLKAAEPYDAALQELREYLLGAEPSEVIALELNHTERFIGALEKEKRVVSELIKRYIKLAERHAEEEEE